MAVKLTLTGCCRILFFIALLFPLRELSAQSGDSKTGKLSGNFQSDFQYYREDEEIDAAVTPENIGFNGYLNLMYQRGKFTAGLRYESYQPALLGYPTNLNGQGVVNRYVTYNSGNLEVTAGNFYEQFGNGLILRSQEVRTLGIDNSIDGFRVKYNLDNKVALTGLIGKHRDGFETSEGTVRALNSEIFLHEIFSPGDPWKTRLTLGGSYVSRFQPYFGGLDFIKENVDAYSGRFELGRGGFVFNSEYVYKQGDPSTVNGFITRPGQMLYMNARYTQRGLGFSVSAQRVDNMDFRTDRTALDNRMLVNFVSANTQQHTYRLITLYPYATQVNGEFSVQAEFVYTFPRKSTLGGKYGTTITLNYARAMSADTVGLPDERGYESDFFGIGDRTYFEDFNLTLSKKWSRKFKTDITYIYIAYDKDQIEGTTGRGIIPTQNIILDMLYKLPKRKSIRVELQHMGTNKDFGSWAMALAELGLAPHWFFYASDEINYNGIDVGKPIHYYNVGSAYVNGGNRFSLSYSRQRAGLICVGGICRIVPASNGLTFSVTSTF